MVFDAYVECPLPKLYSFAVYLTHRDINPHHHSDIHDSLKDFYKAAIPTDLKDLVGAPDTWRLEFYFVPGATDTTECIAHFYGELVVRDSFNGPIRRYRGSRRADPPREPPSPPGTLPVPDLAGAANNGSNGSDDPGWVMWQVWFGSKPTRKLWEMEEWERGHFGLREYDNGPPEGWVDDDDDGDGHGDAGGERQPIVKSRCTMTRENPLWDGEGVITFSAIMSANRPMVHEKVGDFWTNAKLWGWKNW
ncbi:hypothetical protein BJY01DRAFT_253909 [Aspergillus pseudoustus]|uniref:Uncharacterized protein n=1 Tax=Aspergillus pseudoustus TaxID=1810923 RepID=A0ABR4IWZ9_9EURO